MRNLFIIIAIIGSIALFSCGETVHFPPAEKEIVNVFQTPECELISQTVTEATIKCSDGTIIIIQIEPPECEECEECEDCCEGDCCGDDCNGPVMITICHKPGTPAEKTMSIPAPAVPGHLGHGDYLGVCENDYND
jgi:hypothetical protein